MKKQLAPDSYKYTRLIPFVHIEDDASTTAVLWTLCAMAHGKTDEEYEVGTCDPGITYIANSTQLSSSTVKRSLKKLTQAGLLSVRVRGTTDNRQSSLYKLDYDKLLALLRACDDSEKEYAQTVRDNWSAAKRRQRSECPAQGEPDNDGDVRVKTEECPAQMPHMSGSTETDVRVKSGKCPAHRDTLTTYNYGLTSRTTKELEKAENQTSGSLDLKPRKGKELTADQPMVREEKIRQAKEKIWRWERQLQQARQSGSPDIHTLETRLHSWRDTLNVLLATPLELTAAA